MSTAIPYGRWEPLLLSEEEGQREQAVELFFSLDPTEQRHLLRVLAHQHRRQRLCPSCRFNEVDDTGVGGCAKARGWLDEVALAWQESRPAAEWARRLEEWNRLQSFDDNRLPTKALPCPAWEAKETAPP